QAPDLAGIALHHGVAQAHLAVAADDDPAIAAHGENGGAAVLFHGGVPFVAGVFGCRWGRFLVIQYVWRLTSDALPHRANCPALTTPAPPPPQPTPGDRPPPPAPPAPA